MSDAQTPSPSLNAPMKVQKQIRLPLSKAIEISLKSIKIRLSRSMITASGILLGIAFFSSVYAARLFPIKGTSAEALSAANRQDYLAVMALIVCFVGIMNAMLMSVTERFKESGAQVNIVSRFQKPSDVKESLKKLKDGKVDSILVLPPLGSSVELPARP